MIIKEGSNIKLITGNDILVEKIVAQEDIEFENSGSGYSFLLRVEGSEENTIFESEKVLLVDEEYIVTGYFKDSVLVIKNKNGNEMHESYLEYDWFAIGRKDDYKWIKMITFNH